MWKSCGRGFFNHKHTVMLIYLFAIVLGQLEYFPLSPILE